MALRTLAALAALCALAPATAGASARPNFPERVAGTITGSSVLKTEGNTVKTTWTVSGARFKLVHVRSVEGSWTGFYSVTAGSVAFKQVETGVCGYTLEQKFALKSSLPKSKVSTPLALTRSLTGHDTYDGDLDPTKKWTVLEACNFPDQDAEVRDRTVNVPDLFSTGEKSSKIGRAMTGKFVYRDDAPSFDSTTTYKWTLR